MSEFKDWAGIPEVSDTMGNGWGVRINGCDVFDSINQHGVKPFRSFDIIRGLSTREEAEKFRLEWLRKQLPDTDREAALREELAKFNDAMRALACNLGAGGYNAEFLTADQLANKIQWGIDNLVKAEQQRLTAAEQRNAELSAIGILINTQDNRCTDQPLFAVMEKRGMVTLDTHDHNRIEWVETTSGDYCEADETKARRLEALHQAHRDTPGWERYAIKDVDVFVTACFTEQGCKDFLARDGHNHRQPFIYAFGSYRNGEYQAVRNWLKAMPTLTKPTESGASE